MPLHWHPLARTSFGVQGKVLALHTFLPPVWAAGGTGTRAFRDEFDNETYLP